MFSFGGCWTTGFLRLCHNTIQTAVPLHFDVRKIYYQYVVMSSNSCIVLPVYDYTAVPLCYSYTLHAAVLLHFFCQRFFGCLSAFLPSNFWGLHPKTFGPHSASWLFSNPKPIGTLHCYCFCGKTRLLNAVEHIAMWGWQVMDPKRTTPIPNAKGF